MLIVLNRKSITSTQSLGNKTPAKRSNLTEYYNTLHWILNFFVCVFVIGFFVLIFNSKCWKMVKIRMKLSMLQTVLLLKDSHLCDRLQNELNGEGISHLCFIIKYEQSGFQYMLYIWPNYCCCFVNN